MEVVVPFPLPTDAAVEIVLQSPSHAMRLPAALVFGLVVSACSSPESGVDAESLPGRYTTDLHSLCAYDTAGVSSASSVVADVSIVETQDAEFEIDAPPCPLLARSSNAEIVIVGPALCSPSDGLSYRDFEGEVTDAGDAIEVRYSARRFVDGDESALECSLRLLAE